MRPDPGELARLRKAFAVCGGVDETAGTAVCPEPDRLWRGATGELEAPELRELVDHTAACPLCAAGWRLAMAVAAEMEAAPVPVRARRAAGDERRLTAVAAMAAGLLIAFGIWDLARGPLRIEPTTVVRGPNPVPSPVAAEDFELPRDACRLRWSGPPNARYDLRVFATALAPIVEEYELETTGYSVPPELLADLPAGSRLWWQVDARLPDGTIASSATHRLTLRGVDRASEGQIFGEH